MRLNKIWLTLTPIVLFWYAMGRWDVYYNLRADKEALALLIDPFCNKMSVLCCIYLISILFYHFIKNEINLSFNTTNRYKILYTLYSFTTILLFMYHSYAFGWFIHDNIYGSNTIKLIDWCLDPWLLLYFTYPTINIFFSLQKLVIRLS